MRFPIILIVTICILAMTAYAADPIALSINGVPVGDSLTIAAGERVSFEFKLDKGILIKDIEVNADNNIYDEFFASYLGKPNGFNRYDEPRTYKEEFQIPSMVPVGSVNLEVIVTFEDPVGIEHDYKHKIAVEVVNGSKLAGVLLKILPESTIIEVMNSFKPIPRLNPDVTHNDLNSNDLTALDLNEGEESLAQITELKSEEVRIDPKDMEDKIAALNDPKINEALGNLKGKEIPPAVITKKVFEIKVGNKTIIKSKITISIEGETDYAAGEALVIIPKDIAQDTDMIELSEDAQILVEDPVIKWAFKNIPQDEIKDYSYTVDKDVQNFETIVATRAEEPGFLTKMILKIIRKFTDQ